MTSAERALLERAAKLTPKAKLRVARALVAQVDGDEQGARDAEWIALLEERIDRLVAGRMRVTPATQVIERLRAEFGSKRRRSQHTST